MTQEDKSRSNLFLAGISIASILVVLIVASFLLHHNNPVSRQTVVTSTANQTIITSTTTVLGGSKNTSAPTTSEVASASTTTTTSPLAGLTSQEQVVANFAINYNTYNYPQAFNDSSVTQYVDPSISASLMSELKTLQKTYQYYRETRVPDLSSLGVTPDPTSPNSFYVFLAVEVTSPFDLGQYGQILTKPTEASYKVTLGINNLITALSVNG